MANAFLNATEYANVMLLLAKNNLVTGKLVDGRHRNEVTDQNGLTISVKRPPRFAPNDASAYSAALATQDVVTGSINIAVNQYAKVHLSIGDIESITSWNQLMRSESMKSAAQTLSHQIDKFLQSKVLGFNNWVSGAATGSVNALTATAASPIASAVQARAAYTRLAKLGVPTEGLNATIDPADGELIMGNIASSNIQSENADALKRARIPMISEVNFYQTQQCATLTTGSRVATADDCQIDNGTLSVNYRDVKNAGSYTQTIHIDGATTDATTITAGEVLTIAGVYDYDWRNGKALPWLKQFTVVSAATFSSNETDLVITPPLIVPGTSDGVDTNANTAFATVSAAAVDGANVNFVGAASTAYTVRAAWRKNAIAMVSAKLETPFTGESSFATDPETGISIRYWRGSDISTGAHIHRWDCVYGASVTDCEMGTRNIGS